MKKLDVIWKGIWIFIIIISKGMINNDGDVSDALIGANVAFKNNAEDPYITGNVFL